MLEKLKFDNRMKAFLLTFFILEFGHAFLDFAFFSHIRENFGLFDYLVFPLISAGISATVGYFVEPKIEKTFGNDNTTGQGIFNKKFLIIIFGVLIILAFISGIYTVSTGEGVILTSLSGHKTQVTDVGFHYRLAGFSSIERYDLRTHTDSGDYLTAQTKEGNPIAVSYVLTSKINNLNNFAVQSISSYEQLSKIIKADVSKIALENSYQDIFSQDIIESSINKDLMSIADKLGIEVENFKLVVTDPTDVISAKSQAQTTKIQAQAELDKANNLKQAIEIQTEAIKGLTPEQLDYLEKMKLYDVLSNNKNTIYVVPSSSSSVLIQNGQTNNNN